VGTYAACYVLTQAILPLSLVLSRGCFAPFAQALSNGRRDQASRLLSQGTRLAVLVSAWGAALAFLYGDAIVRLVYGSRFVVPGALLGLLSLGMFGMAMLWFFCEMLAAAGRLKIRLRLMAGVSVISLAATLLMVRTWGPWGAAWALVIGGSSGILAAGVLRRLIGAFIPWSTLLRATVAATAIIFGGRLGQSAFQGPAVPLGMLAASLGYLALLVMLHEWRFAKPQFAGRPLRSPPRSALSPLPKGEEYD
jgi:O-antigen/teichoic acid export membrane protein